MGTAWTGAASANTCSDEHTGAERSDWVLTTTGAFPSEYGAYGTRILFPGVGSLSSTIKIVHTSSWQENRKVTHPVIGRLARQHVDSGIRHIEINVRVSLLY